MKILVDAHIFDHSYQGTHTYIKGLYNAMVKFNNIEIHLCANDITNLKNSFQDDRYFFIKLKSNNKWKRLLFEIPSILRAEKFDYAHFQYITPFFGNTKFITTIHDVLFLDFPDYFPFSYRIVKSFLFWFSAKKSNLVLTVSEHSKRAIIKYFNIKEGQVFITPNAVEIKDYTAIKFSEEQKVHFSRKYILYVSRFEPRKNQIGLLEVMLRLNLFDKDYYLFYIGGKKESIEFKYYINLIKRIPKNYASKIVFLENVSEELLQQYYTNANCFVYPSFAEGFGIPPLEAATLGTKVLCSNTTAMKDFSFFPYQFNPNDQDDFALKLEQILLDNNYPSEKIKNAILNKYNWNKIATDFKEYLIKMN